MNYIKNYILLNPELKEWNINDIKKEYNKNIIDNNRITSIDNFFKKYNNFDINICKKFNPNIENLSLIEILGYINLNNNKIVYSYESFYNLLPNFDIKIIKKTVKDNGSFVYNINVKNKVDKMSVLITIDKDFKRVSLFCPCNIYF